MEKEGYKSVFLHSSSIFAEGVPCQITTILGSCISVCLWDSKLKIGGMNHYMLSLWNGDGLASPKFGNIAIEKLIEKMIKLGSDQKNLQAKIFGGADLFDRSKRESVTIGGMNIKIAEEILKRQRIRIVNCSVGGKQGRKIIFNTSTGEVLLKYIQKGLIPENTITREISRKGQI
jgi:chemotaxis protein CheD